MLIGFHKHSIYDLKTKCLRHANIVFMTCKHRVYDLQTLCLDDVKKSIFINISTT